MKTSLISCWFLMPPSVNLKILATNVQMINAANTLDSFRIILRLTLGSSKQIICALKYMYLAKFFDNLLIAIMQFMSVCFHRLI